MNDMAEKLETSIDAARQFGSSHPQLLINGEFTDSRKEQMIATTDPSTGKVWTEVQAGGTADIDRAVQAAHSCFENTWSKTGPRERERMIRRFCALLDQHADTLAAIDALDCGSVLSMIQSRGKGLWLDTVEYFAGWPTKIAGQSFAPMERPQTAGRTTSLSTTFEPMGVVGCILPWNAPGTFVLNKAIPALAAGCTVVIKPAEQTPVSALFIGDLLREAGLPPGTYNVVNGYGETAGAALSQHPLVKKISFTGSTEVGRLIALAGAKTFKRLTLELGGKSAFIVMADADIDLAARQAAMSGYFLSGQFCMCPSRLFVEQSVRDEFVEKLSNNARQINVGSSYAAGTLMGPVITGEDRDRVGKVVERAQNDGAELIYGGSVIDREGHFFEPTLMQYKDTGIDIAQSETFGPVLLTVPFDGNDKDALIRVANETNYGLAASVWTTNLATGHEFAARLQAGVVGVNDHATVDSMAPFGGIKDSGVGREFGQDGFESFMEKKTISICY